MRRPVGTTLVQDGNNSESVTGVELGERGKTLGIGRGRVPRAPNKDRQKAREKYRDSRGKVPKPWELQSQDTGGTQEGGGGSEIKNPRHSFSIL